MALLVHMDVCLCDVRRGEAFGGSIAPLAACQIGLIAQRRQTPLRSTRAGQKSSIIAYEGEPIKRVKSIDLIALIQFSRSQGTQLIESEISLSGCKLRVVSSSSVQHARQIGLYFARDQGRRAGQGTQTQS
jgi:hypothetical protein